MQIFSIFGVVIAVANLAHCTAKEAGYIKDDGKPIFTTFDLSDALAEKLEKKPDSIDIPLDTGNVVKKNIIDALREAYLKDVEKTRHEAMSRDDAYANETLALDTGGEPSSKSVPNDTLSSPSGLEAASIATTPRNRGITPALSEAISRIDEMDPSTNDIFSTNSTLSRNKRATVINVPIPTLLGFVPGTDDSEPDLCDRDEVLFGEEDCYELLDQGPCEDDQYVLMDAVTKKGYCAPRLCAPGKVFLFNDQLCHDPREAGLCPPGRMLFTSSFGTPLCGCPDGTYEEDDDLDDDVCEPVLGQIPNCPPGEVFWFTDFRRPPSCKPDPCKGVNLKRGPEDLPYVPSRYDGKCYKIGSQPKFCRRDQFYSLSLKYLKGVCSSLDDAGYTVLDSGDIASFTQTFGSFITTSSGSSGFDSSRFGSSSFGSSRFDSSRRRPSSKPRVSSEQNSDERPNFLSFKPSRRKITPAGTTLLTRPAIGAPVMKMENSSFYQSPIVIGQSVVANHHPVHNEVDSGRQVMALVPTHMNAFSTPLISVDGFMAGAFPTHHFGRSMESDDDDSDSTKEEESRPFRKLRHHRGKRSPLPFASPGNVIEPGLTACRAGAIRDINAKCRNTVLPSRFPPSRPVRDVAAVPPRPSCPGGSFWGLGRTCTSSSSGISSIINRFGLG